MSSILFMKTLYFMFAIVGTLTISVAFGTFLGNAMSHFLNKQK